MPQLTRDGLDALRAELRKSTRLGAPGRRVRLTVHLGTCGLASGAGKVLDAARAALEERAVDDVVITTSGCAGLCCREPMATVELAGEPPVKYADLNEKKIVEIIDEHVLGGRIVPAFVLGTGEERRA
ncbi:MAG: (2Fe-2S) ferredoxin domain-containing protein [Candidatus Eisenbacteria sp.]|nr:(2Fe-2S) ferredoxin domain-containing protein [Candidatus Eisenbacteria bacterium]